MTGLKISQPLSNELMVGFSQNVPGKSPADPAPSRRSAPAQNALPAPVTIATHASSSSRNRLNASLRSRRISPLIAFNASGRLYVIVARCPSRSYVAVSLMQPFVAAPAEARNAPSCDRPRRYVEGMSPQAEACETFLALHHGEAPLLLP